MSLSKPGETDGIAYRIIDTDEGTAGWPKKAVLPSTSHCDSTWCTFLRRFTTKRGSDTAECKTDESVVEHTTTDAVLEGPKPEDNANRQSYV